MTIATSDEVGANMQLPYKARFGGAKFGRGRGNRSVQCVNTVVFSAIFIVRIVSYHQQVV